MIYERTYLKTSCLLCLLPRLSNPLTASLGDRGEPDCYPFAALTDFPDNRVFDIIETGEGIRVVTLEVPAGTGISTQGIFEFTRDFQLRRASWSDGYRLLHRKLEREGKIDHPWERCTDRFGPRVVRA